jgi:NADH-quinone oxidoreductase subunit L
MMALIQKDYKRLLSYHAISQVGYMILGIGTLLPAGIVGGIFHMINNALYKSGLFLTAGAVEREAGTTDLERLGGLKTAMPATFACFLIMAASISGVPPFNGFFSKELIYDGALARGRIFYLAALAGSFLTAASFLKLGHAAFLGKGSKAAASVKDPPSAMMIPMVTIALVCIIFGVWNTLPLKGLIEPAVGLERLEGHEISGMPSSMLLVALTMMVLIGALLNHLYGVRRTGSGLKAADHIHYAPILSNIYSEAEKGRFDPYNIGRVAVRIVSRIAWYLDRAVDFFTGALPAGAGRLSGTAIRRLHNGSHKTYLIWSVAGLLLVLYFMVRG